MDSDSAYNIIMDCYLSPEREVSVDSNFIDEIFSESDANSAFEIPDAQAQMVESVLDKALAPQSNGKKKSNKYEKCFLLMWRYGMKDRDIAHVLKISRSSVRHHIRRAVKKIQKELINIKK